MTNSILYDLNLIIKEKIELMRYLLIIETIFLLCYSSLMNVDYQDKWDLAGLEFIFIIYIISYLFYFYWRVVTSMLLGFFTHCFKFL